MLHFITQLVQSHGRIHMRCKIDVIDLDCESYSSSYYWRPTSVLDISGCKHIHYDFLIL